MIGLVISIVFIIIPMIIIFIIRSSKKAKLSSEINQNMDEVIEKNDTYIEWMEQIANHYSYETLYKKNDKHYVSVDVEALDGSIEDITNMDKQKLKTIGGKAKKIKDSLGINLFIAQKKHYIYYRNDIDGFVTIFKDDFKQMQKDFLKENSLKNFENLTKEQWQKYEKRLNYLENNNNNE